MANRFARRDAEITTDNVEEYVKFDYELEQMFDEWMDEIYPLVKIGPHSLRPSRCLKEADPAGYREDCNNWMDSEGWDEVEENVHFG